MDELDKELMYVPTATPWRTRLSVGLRVKFFLTGIVYPACCLMWIVGGLKPFLGGDLWQDGQTNAYVGVLMSAPAFCVFIPIGVVRLRRDVLCSTSRGKFDSIKPFGKATNS